MNNVNLKKILGFLLSALILFTFFLQIKTDNNTHKFTIYSTDGEDVVELSNSNKLEQTFNLECNEIKSFWLFPKETKKLNNFHLNYQLVYKNKVLRKGSLTLDSVSSDSPISIDFKKSVKNVRNKKLKFVLSTDSNEYISFGVDEKNNLGTTVISQELTRFFLISILIGAVVVLFTLLVYYLLFIRKISFNKLFIVSIILFGFLINFLVALGNVPDETPHYLTVYHYSNTMLGIKDDFTNVTMRKCDQETLYKYEFENDYKFETYLNDLFDTSDQDTSLTKSGKACLDVKKYSFTYYLSALGMTVGRLCHLNSILCAFLARLMNFLFFAIVSYLCIKTLPVFKELFSYICLLPITLQQAFSLSYDAIVITLALIISTFVVKLYYDKSLSKRNTTILIISCVLLSLCKSFAYSPIILAPLSFYLLKWWDKVRKKVNLKIVFTICALFILFGCACIFIMNRTVVEGSTLYLCGHPILLYKWVKGTFFNTTVFLLKTTFGTALGQCSIFVFEPLIFLIVFNLFYILMRTNVENIYIPDYSKGIFILIFLVVFFGIFLAMYGWTYKIDNEVYILNKIIDGIQGRYFIPLMPLLFICFCNNKNEYTGFSNIALYNSILICALTVISAIIYVG